MKKLNFNNIKNLNVPENWVDNALNIPESYAEKKHINFIKLSRIITVAACVVIIGTISLTLFFTKNNNMLVGVKNTNSTETIFTTTENGTYNSYTENKTTTTSALSTVKSYESAEFPTQSSSNNNNATYGTEPPELATDTPLNPTEPQTDYNEPETTRAQNTSPTYTQQTPTSTTQSDWTDSTYVCIGHYSLGMTVSSVFKAYCKIYDEQGNLLGDSNLYSSEHIATTKETTDDYIQLYYEPTKAGLKLSAGKYSYHFYDEYGIELYKDYLYVK